MTRLPLLFSSSPHENARIVPSKSHAKQVSREAAVFFDNKLLVPVSITFMK